MYGDVGGQYQVVVVGAGPVGMTVAALLARYGVKVLVLERNATTSDDPKAVSVNDEALRVYQWAGLVREVLRIVVPGTGTRYYDRTGKPVFHAGAPEPMRFGYPFKNPFAQPELEGVLFDRLRRRTNVRVRMGVQVLDASTQADGVELHTSHGVVRARYVLGCDGGRSTLREALGLGMTGRSYPDVWLVADVLGDHHDQRYGMHHGDPNRPHVIIPGRDGRCRYEFLLRDGEGAAGVPPDFELVRRLLSPYREVIPNQVERAVNYRFNASVADRWRDGGAFLLGDAAHMMPPFAGQGLNSGIRDAANLAWKLADVLAGRLTDTALDSYETERRPHAAATVRLSQRLRQVVMTTSQRVARHRDDLIGRVLETEQGRDFLEHMRFRPPHRYSEGLLVPDRHGWPTGVTIGQPRVFDTTDHRIRLLDNALGHGWALVGVGLPASEFVSAATAVSTLRPSLVQVPLDDHLGRNSAGLRVLLDLDGQLAGELAPYRDRFVLLRPDRFVAASWAPGQPPEFTGPLHLRRDVEERKNH